MSLKHNIKRENNLIQIEFEVGPKYVKDFILNTCLNGKSETVKANENISLFNMDFTNIIDNLYRKLNLEKLIFNLLNDDEKDNYEIIERFALDPEDLKSISKDLEQNKITIKSLLAPKIKIVNEIDYKNIKLMPKLDLSDNKVYNFIYELMLENNGFAKSTDKKLTENNYGIFIVEKMDLKTNKIIETYEIKSFYDYMYVDPILKEHREKLNGLSINNSIVINDTEGKSSFKITLKEILNKNFDETTKKIGYINVNDFVDLKIHVLSHFNFQKNEYLKELKDYYVKKEIFKLVKLNNEINKTQLDSKISFETFLFEETQSNYQYLISNLSSKIKSIYKNSSFIEICKVDLVFDKFVDYISTKEKIKVSKAEIANLVFLKRFCYRNKINKFNKLYWEDELQIIKNAKFSKYKIDFLNKLKPTDIEIIKKIILKEKVIKFLYELNSNNETLSEKEIKDFKFNFNTDKLRVTDVYKLKIDDEIENIFDLK